MKIVGESIVIVSGGLPVKGYTEASMMKDWLIRNGVQSAKIIEEDQSVNTIDNALKTMKIVNKLSSNTELVLITSESHMKRALAMFECVQSSEGTGHRFLTFPCENIGKETAKEEEREKKLLIHFVAHFWGVSPFMIYE